MSKKYFKSEIEPEEILLDKKLATKLETPIKTTGIFFVFGISILTLFLFWTRTFWLQIAMGDYYSEKSSKNSIRLYPSPAPRGEIYDRNKKMLTNNTPEMNLMVIPADLPKNKSELTKWIEKISDILKTQNSKIESLVGSFPKNSTEPTLLASNIDRDSLFEIETQLSNLPGIFINAATQRLYFDGTYFSHIIGYLGKVTSSDLKNDSYYSLFDLKGKAGLEMIYEKEMRGVNGKTAVSVSSSNEILKTVVAEEPQAGNNLILSIDAELQKILVNSLKVKMADTGSNGSAGIVLNAKSGEIMALASLPSFNNEAFNKGMTGEEYLNISQNKNRPLFNRAIAGFYPAGSTIKPFIAAAALAEKIIDPEYKIDDSLGYISVPNQYDSAVTYTYRDWKAHGFVDMRRAIAVSANVYFYIVGGGYKNIKGLGINKIDEYLNLFGFGSRLGVDLPGEALGIVPSPKWKKETKNEDWFTGDTYNVSIGQGDIIITPLQLASGIAAIANGGTLWRPKLVSAITDREGKTVREIKPEAMKINLIKQEDLSLVKEGMRGAVTEGSARMLNELPIEVAGKTGTAQVTNSFKKTNAWFAGFAPYENPEISLAIVIEGAGEGSAAAVPVAKEIFEWYYGQINDKIDQ